MALDRCRASGRWRSRSASRAVYRLVSHRAAAGARRRGADARRGRRLSRGFRFGATVFFGAPNDAAVAAASCCTLHDRADLFLGLLFRGAGRPERRRHASHGRWCPAGRALTYEMSLLRSSRRQSRRLARKQGRRGHPPAARMPRVRQAVHQLRADRRDPVHGREERRHPRAVRSPEADTRAAQGVREAAGQRCGGRGDRRPRRGDAAGSPGEGNRDGRHRRVRDGRAPETRQSGLRSLRVGLPTLPRHRRVRR